MNGVFNQSLKNPERVGYLATLVMAKPAALCLF